MNMFNNLSSLQRNFIRGFIRDCFIFLGLITWPVFGFVSIVNEWKLCYPIVLAPFIFLVLFIIVMGIYMFIIRSRFKWQIMGVLTKEEYNSVIHKLWVYSWNFNEIYNIYNDETNPLFLEVLDKVKPFWNDRLEW